MACIPRVIRNKSLKPIICFYRFKILRSKNAFAIKEVNSGLAGSAAMYVAIVCAREMLGGAQGPVLIMNLMFLNTGVFRCRHLCH